jgi:hypothetical protein
MEHTMNALKIWSLSLTVVVAAVAAACGPVAMAATSGATAAHAHDHAAPAKLRPEHGRKWKTDAPLRSGMERVRTVVQAQMASTHAGKATPEQYAALASQVEIEVGKIVANCKLPPQADAALHVIIGEMMAGTSVMAGKTPGARPEQGLVQVAGAVNDYGRYFEHPGFQRLATNH